MGLYVRAKDRNFFDHVNMEILEKVVEVQVLLYQIDVENVSQNIYGESVEKIFLPPVALHCLISYQETNTESSEFGKDLKNGITFRFHRLTLEKKKVFPMAGDVIKWNDYFFEIDTIIQATQYPGQEYPFSFYIANAHLTRISKLSIKNSPTLKTEN